MTSLVLVTAATFCMAYCTEAEATFRKIGPPGRNNPECKKSYP